MLRIIPLLLLTTPALAAGFQDTAGLDRAVMAFTGRPIGAEGGARTPVDPRLRLATCPTIAMSWRTEAHDAVVITCSGPDWRIFVPVLKPVAAVTVRPTTVAAVAAAPAAKAEIVIKRGDPVMIEAGSAGFSISRQGIAMGDAAAGARFMVKVEDTRTPVQAVAIEAGRATLPGWTE